MQEFEIGDFEIADLVMFGIFRFVVDRFINDVGKADNCIAVQVSDTTMLDFLSNAGNQKTSRMSELYF